jgi:hypothetical protein
MWRLFRWKRSFFLHSHHVEMLKIAEIWHMLYLEGCTINTCTSTNRKGLKSKVVWHCRSHFQPTTLDTVNPNGNSATNRSINQSNRYKAIDYTTESFSWRSSVSPSLPPTASSMILPRNSSRFNTSISLPAAHVWQFLISLMLCNYCSWMNVLK